MCGRARTGCEVRGLGLLGSCGRALAYYQSATSYFSRGSHIVHRRTATATISMLVTALAAVLVGATPAQAARVQTGVSMQAMAAKDIQGPSTSEVRHTSVTKTGGQVRERLVIHLVERAKITNLWVYQILGLGHFRAVRGPVDLGWLSPGWHSWTWSGYDNRGKQVPDGHYEVRADVFFANSGSWQGQVLGRALVHRHYAPGYLTSQFPALYPRSTTIHDSTTLENQRPFPTRATMRVRNRSGKVVFTRAIKALRKNMRVTWDGRDARGRALPAGNYYAKASGVDMDGLRGSAEAQKVVVSAKRLVSVTRTVTVSPTASRTSDFPLGCNGCPDIPRCGGVVPSDRFAEEGALSYRSGTDCAPNSMGPFTNNALSLHELAPRAGSTSVSVFGGPTTPGATDQGYLSITGYAGETGAPTGPDTGDHTSTTPWTNFTYRRPLVGWSFGTPNGSSYDVATFTVRFKFLTPRY